MDENLTNAIQTVSIVWDGRGSDRNEYGPWLLTFHLTDLGDGRLQCVGFEMRSYLKESAGGAVAPVTWADPSETEPTPPASEEAAAWLAERESEGLPVPDLGVAGWAPSKRARHLRDHLPVTDREAASASAEDSLTRPRELQAQMVKGLQLGSWLGMALQRAAREQTGHADFFGEILQDEDLFATMPAEEAARQRRALNTVAEVAEESAAELNARHRRPGRPKEHGPEQLRKAAILYTTFLRRGSRNPTALLAESLGVKRNIAAKLVKTCRRQDIDEEYGLLLPVSTGPRAETWGIGEAPWEQTTEADTAATPRETDERKGQK